MPGCPQSHSEPYRFPTSTRLGLLPPRATGRQVMPDDHSELEPPLPIPNRTVKRLCADDSEHSLVKVGHRQATPHRKYAPRSSLGAFLFSDAGLGPSLSHASPAEPSGCPHRPAAHRTASPPDPVRSSGAPQVFGSARSKLCAPASCVVAAEPSICLVRTGPVGLLCSPLSR